MSVIVYVLTNPAMPDLVKIGFTSRRDLNERMKDLQTTGVPLPFECAWALEVEDDQVGQNLELALHKSFRSHRINPNREFFELETEDAIAVLKVFPGKDVTPQLKGETGELDPGSRRATDRFTRKRRPNLNFDIMGIPPGTALTNQINDETAEVIGPKKVRFRGEEMSLSAATMSIRDGKYSPPLQNWECEGRRLVEIWRETMLTDEDDE